MVIQRSGSRLLNARSYQGPMERNPFSIFLKRFCDLCVENIKFFYSNFESSIFWLTPGSAPCSRRCLLFFYRCSTRSTCAVRPPRTWRRSPSPIRCTSCAHVCSTHPDPSRGSPPTGTRTFRWETGRQRNRDREIKIQQQIENREKGMRKKGRAGRRKIDDTVVSYALYTSHSAVADPRFPRGRQPHGGDTLLFGIILAKTA